MGIIGRMNGRPGASRRAMALLIAAAPFFVQSAPASGAGAGIPDGKPDRGCAAELRLTPETASSFARIALACVQREYPNKPDHVMNGEADSGAPSFLHPAFFGCFDWHSSVHGHWLLARLVNIFPDLPEAEEARRALSSNITRENILAEAAYFGQENRRSFERTYGWAWLLKLSEELGRSDDPVLKGLHADLQPLAEVIAGRYMDFLPRQTYPIRRGVHPNTAFGIAFALDYSRAEGDSGLERMLVERSIGYFGGDSGVPAGWEPDGDDFFSPSLMEADLMRRVLPAREFADWFHAFLPEIAEGRPASLLEPAVVSDRSDPKIVHLDGLNLSRAWCMLGIASALDPSDPARGILEDSACLHARTALEHVASGNYEGEHWLASFAVYLLTSRPGPR